MTLAPMPQLVRPTTTAHHRPRTRDLVVLAGSPEEGHGPSDALQGLLPERHGVLITASAQCTESTGWCADGRAAFPAETVVVPLSQAEIAGYGAGMSDATLWRLYSGAHVLPEFCTDWWASYRLVNRRFAEAAARVAAPSGTVWIRSHRLQLVPALLRATRPDLAIGYTSRLPFPPPELFARLPWKRQLLEGLSAADLIGLPRRSDVMNFLHAVRRFVPPAPASAVRGEGGHDASGAARGQPVVVDLTFPGWVDARAVDRDARSADVIAGSERLRSTLGNPATLLLSVDPMEPTRGIPQRLEAFAALLADGRLDASTTVYVQATLPSPHDPDGELRRLVEATVARINGRFAGVGRPVIHYLHRSLPPRERMALYRAADVLVAPPLSEDTCSAVQEYLAARHDGLGALILSEFSGSAEEFPAAAAVNPYDAQALQDALAKVCKLELREIPSQMAVARARLMARSREQAMRDFLDEVALARAARPANITGRTRPDPAGR
jgi:trehalose 6-phosphate synthase